MKDNLGALISKTRKEKNLSKEELAQKLGVNSSTISKWEKNIVKPSFSNLILLTKVLDLSFDELILGHEINKTNKKKSDEELTDLLKRNAKYKVLFNVFAGIFVCLCLCFIEAVLYKYNLVSRDSNYIFLLLIFMICFVAYSESLEKANLLEEKNKYRECALFLIFAFILSITGFILLVVK